MMEKEILIITMKDPEFYCEWNKWQTQNYIILEFTIFDMAL